MSIICFEFVLLLCYIVSSQRVVSKGDTNNDGLMDFSEFVKYCQEHEKKLWLVFNDLDLNKDGGNNE